MKRRSALPACALALAACAGIWRAPEVHSQASLFPRASQVPVGAGSGQVVLVDVNGDGRMDMVTRHLLQRAVAVFVGDGRGGFTPGASGPLALGYPPGTIAVADLSGDAIPDLAVANSERDEVDLFLGDGAGGFTRAAGSPFAASASRELYTRMLRLADVNDDGRVDIVTANGRDNTFGILFGDGRGGFAAGPIAKGESNETSRHAFAFGDVDGDGRIDAVVASRAGEGISRVPGRVTVMRGDGHGGFREAAPPLIVAPGPHFVALADLNGDRRPDLAISHSAGHRISVLLNDGRGGFTAAPGSPVDAETEAFALVVADVDRSGTPDLLAATVWSATVLLGDGRGRFVPAPGSPFPAGPGAYSLTTGDVNGDDRLDIATSSFEGDRVTVLFGR